MTKQGIINKLAAERDELEKKLKEYEKKAQAFDKTVEWAAGENYDGLHRTDEIRRVLKNNYESEDE